MYLRTSKVFLVLGLAALVARPALLRAQGTEFTYQGRLNDGGIPANGPYDFRFRLASDPQGNTYVGGAYLTNGVAVSNGLFTTTLDFGTAIFNGADYWLEVEVRTNGASSFVGLAPLQALTPVPYAIYAKAAASLGGTLSAANLSGAYSNAVTFNNDGNNFHGTFDGNGGNVTNVNAATLNGLNAASFWQLSGNNASAGQILGTLNNQPLELWVNGQRALRIEPNTNGAPNVISGAPFNFADPSVYAATIAGGGAVNSAGTATSNSVASVFGTVGGGGGNAIELLSGGSTVAGGQSNVISSNASVATIGGGYANTISNGAFNATIAGGYVNSLASPWTTISGGGYHSIGTNSNSSTISGGYAHTIRDNSYDCTIGGGSFSTIGTNSNYSTIAGGRVNTIGDNSTSSSISGGLLNIIQTNINFGVVGGGYLNQIGGSRTTVGILLDEAQTIGGGAGNFIGQGSAGNLISGGENNAIQPGTKWCTIGGGLQNMIETNAQYGTIAGGFNNSVAGNFSCAAGQNAEASNNGSFVWNSFGSTNSVTQANTFSVFGAHGLDIEYYSQAASGAATRYLYAGDLFAGDTIHAWNGAHLTDGGVWSNASDKNRKTGFTDVDPRALLGKLAALPVREWRYTNEVAGIKHLGPTAQDFRAAFGLGADDQSIGTVDEEGVALAAIQGLNQKLNEKDAEIQKLKQEAELLEQRLDFLARHVKSLSESN